MVRDWFADTLLPLVVVARNTEPSWNVARLDLAADIAGLNLTPEHFARFTTRARTRRSFYAGETISDPEPLGTTLYTGRSLTGFTFGRRGSPCHARIYDKTREAAPDAPTRVVWREAGYDPALHGERVWRVEFEMRSALLRELVVGGMRLPTEPLVLLTEHLDDVWRYLVSDWLVLRAPGATRLERAPVVDWREHLAELGGLSAASGPRSVELGRPLRTRGPKSRPTQECH